MKRQTVKIFFVGILLIYWCYSANAQKINTANFVPDSVQLMAQKKKVAIKFYPTSLLLSQAPQLCSEIQFALQYRVAKRQRFHVGISAAVPNPFVVITGNMISDPNQYLFYGGKGVVGYRYYMIDKKTNNKEGFFIGGEISVMGLQSEKRTDKAENSSAYYSSDWRSPEFSAHAILTNYNFITGFEFISLRKKGKGIVTVEISASVGFRYHYLWRHYFSSGNLEFYKYQKNGLYWYYKKVPIGGSINLSIGGWI